MIAAQDAISIPVVYIETFVMTFVAFSIGYCGAILYSRSKAKRVNKQHKNELLKLKNTISNLKSDLDAKADSVFRKDRMDQDLEQVNFQRRAYSEEILEGKAASNPAIEINFDRIGRASSSQGDDLQQISGIGPFTASKLNDLGIYTFEQISKFNDEDINTVTRLIKFFPDRIKNDRWVLKAKTLSESKDSSSEEDNNKNTRLKKI